MMKIRFLFLEMEEDDDVARPDWFICMYKDYALMASSGWSTKLVEDCHMTASE